MTLLDHCGPTVLKSIIIHGQSFVIPIITFICKVRKLFEAIVQFTTHNIIFVLQQDVVYTKHLTQNQDTHNLPGSDLTVVNPIQHTIN